MSPPPAERGYRLLLVVFSFPHFRRALGINTNAFAEAVTTEGVHVSRTYLPAPLFEYDVIKHQRTYGESRYPFPPSPTILRIWQNSRATRNSRESSS